MIYITRNRGDVVTTDSTLEYIPELLDVYLDDIFVGTYSNVSTSNLYLMFTVPLEDIKDFQDKEYIMIIKSFSRIIKKELVIVKDYTTIKVTSIDTSKKIIFYE